MSDQRYDRPGRNGLGRFGSFGFSLGKNAPEGESAKDTTPIPGKPGRSPDAFTRLITPVGITPDQGCIATIVGTLLLVVSLGFWLFIYITHADEFRMPGATYGPSKAQVEHDRQISHRNRINP